MKLNENSAEQKNVTRK